MRVTILNFFKFCVIIVTLCSYVQGQQNKVSPKLDFEEEDDETSNSTVLVIPGDGTKAKGDGKYNVKVEADEKETTTNKDGDKSGPKIHGVRVTVDTGDRTKESKESVEITDLSKHKKRVGIHTDITFEITAGDDDNDNKTSLEQDIDKEDANVPIFKGRDGSRHKSRKPYDPKSQWNPNFSTEHRVYDVPDQGRDGYSGYFPEYYPHNVPVYVGTSDERSGADSIYRQNDGWNSYIPRYWTTERTYAYRSNDVSNYHDWKPCYCATSSNEYRRRRHSHRHGTHNRPDFVVNPTSSIIKILDGKLERPFSKE
ncbi:uncharacterized protein LOC119640558 [Glossina fuscipes]|uniref:Uncharacterized protein LOC119640558 n=1 Tax=Glossina fuscipes TaxID=7396 RepID=A0A9C5ZHL5_9MUSC|nr:uncharacterized protein LOC119640558 [Glossina fuscipes]